MSLSEAKRLLDEVCKSDLDAEGPACKQVTRPTDGGNGAGGEVRHVPAALE